MRTIKTLNQNVKKEARISTICRSHYEAKERKPALRLEMLRL